MKKNTLGSLIWLRISRFAHQSILLSDDYLKQYNITSSQFDVLNQISVYQPITQTELAKKVTITQGGISRMLTRLEKEELIHREQEWKTKYISLTEKGTEKLEEAFSGQLDFQSSFFEESLSKEEQKTLLSLMSRVQKYSNQMMEDKKEGG